MFISINDLPEAEETYTLAWFGRNGSVEVIDESGARTLWTDEARAILTREPHNYELANALRQAELVAFIVEDGRF